MNPIFHRSTQALAMLVLGASSLMGQQAGKPASAAVVPGTASVQVEAPEACQHCGMNRIRFSRSRRLVKYSDDSQAGTCSLRCLVVDLDAKGKKTVSALFVGDYGVEGNPLIDARLATWVIGGKLRGVMTPVAKWAFAARPAAEAFIAVNGGQLATFAEAETAAREDFKGKR